LLDNGSIIWSGLGFSTVQILNLQAGFQLCGLVFNVIAMTFVDRVKRNWIISIGLVGCAVTILIQMLLQMSYLGKADRSGLLGATAMIFLFQATYSLFLDGASYFYIAEIWPSHLRTRGFAIGMASLCGFNMMWLLAAPTAIATISWRFYLFFIIIPALGAILVFFTFPDTLKKPLEEIAAMFGDQDIVAIYQSEVTNADIQLEEYRMNLADEDKAVSMECE
jgi:MFS family permease